MRADGEPLGTIGFVGLGDMGGLIAAHYARSGLDLLAYDLRAQKEAQVSGWGGRWADSAAALVEQSHVLCVCLLDDKQVRAFVDESRVFERLPPEAAFVVHSTISPSLMWQLAEEGATHGIAVVDAPVSRRSHTPRGDGRVTVIVAAEPAVFDRLRPLWEAMSSHSYRVAEVPGRAQVVKLCNNMMVETNYLVALEALRIAEAYDVSESVFLEVVRASSGNSWIIENWSTSDHHMLNHPHGGPEARFSILLKDLQTAIELGRQGGVEPLIAGVAGVAGESVLKNRFDRITTTTQPTQ